MQNILQGRRFRLLTSTMPAALLLAGGTWAGHAHAQQAQSSQLEEIVVTAEKRSENIQQVPIAVTAFSAQTMQDKGVTDIHSLSNLTPNVNLDSASPFSGSFAVLSASIRGIGQDDFAFNLDPGVGVYVDGVYFARTVGANQNLLDVDRVEVLKGPQGTLFGRNTIGGAISVVTRTPGDQFMFEGEVTGGSLDRRDISATADIPISDTLLSSITVSSAQRDGYQKIVPYPGFVGVVDPSSTYLASGYGSNGDTKGGENQQVLRTKFLWKAADNVKVTVSADWTHEDTSAVPNTVLGFYTNGNKPGAASSLFDIYNWCVDPSQFIQPTNILGSGLPVGSAAFERNNWCNSRTNIGGPIASLLPNGTRAPYTWAMANTGNIDTTYATGNNFSKIDSWGASATIDWQLAEDFAMKSITGYRRIQWDVGLDQDGSPLQIQEPSFSEGQHQVSEEVQGIGTAFDDRLNYVAGVYYFNEAGYIHDFVTFPAGYLQVDGLNPLETSSYAAYTHESYKLTDEIGITVGARYSYDHKTFTGGQTDWGGLNYKLLAPLFGCNAPDTLGTIPGTTIQVPCQNLVGFNVPGQPRRYFPPGINTQDFYEFTPTAGAEYHFTSDLMSYFSWSKGFKSGGWTSRLSSPIQFASEAQFGPEKAETYEVGFKSAWFDRRFIANLAGFYTDYSQIQLQQQVGASPVTKNLGDAKILGSELETHALLGGGFSLNANAGYLDAYYTHLDPSVGTAVTLGSKLPKTPKWKFDIGPEYDYDLPNDATLRFLGDYTHTASMFNDSLNTPQLRRPTTDVINASVQYVSPDDRYEVILGGTNITDQRYLTTGSVNTAAGEIDGTYDAPAEWYLTLRIKFQGEKAPAPITQPVAPPPAEQPAQPAAQAPEPQRSFQVFFDFDKSSITDAAAKVIQAAADNEKAGHFTQINVTGHTDTVGSAKYNQALSERRAAAVKQQLIADGVPAAEISAVGVGKTGLLVPTADGVREPQNRRAEIVLQ